MPEYITRCKTTSHELVRKSTQPRLHLRLGYKTSCVSFSKTSCWSPVLTRFANLTLLLLPSSASFLMVFIYSGCLFLVPSPLPKHKKSNNHSYLHFVSVEDVTFSSINRPSCVAKLLPKYIVVVSLFKRSCKHRSTDDPRI